MERADVIILGGGLVGATLALALDAHGLTSIVVDPADPAKTLVARLRRPRLGGGERERQDAGRDRPRPALAGHGCDIRGIRVSDGLAPGALDFAPDPDDGALGHDVREPPVAPRRCTTPPARPRGIDLRMQRRAVIGRPRRARRRGGARRRHDASPRRC